MRLGRRRPRLRAARLIATPAHSGDGFFVIAVEQFHQIRGMLPLRHLGESRDVGEHQSDFAHFAAGPQRFGMLQDRVHPAGRKVLPDGLPQQLPFEVRTITIVNHGPENARAQGHQQGRPGKPDVLGTGDDEGRDHQHGPGSGTSQRREQR